MKSKLQTEEMAAVKGGSHFWDGFCVAIGAANILSPFLAITGVGFVVLESAAVGCLIYKASEL